MNEPCGKLLQDHTFCLIPDIYVERTIEGIRDQRDELMEAAIAFILEGYDDR